MGPVGMSCDLFDSRSGEAANGFLRLLAIAARTPARERERVPPIVIELLQDLNRVSVEGNDQVRHDRVDLVAALAGCCHLVVKARRSVIFRQVPSTPLPGSPLGGGIDQQCPVSGPSPDQSKRGSFCMLAARG
jgi:hypothetical protein